jgi:hypothetical protein
MLHCCLHTPNKILRSHDLIAWHITRRTTLGRRVAILACSAGDGEKVELVVEL